LITSAYTLLQFQLLVPEEVAYERGLERNHIRGLG